MLEPLVPFVDLVTLDDNSATMTFDIEQPKCPWLCLPPWHPVTMDKYQFFASVTAAQANGYLKPGVFTAITGIRWQLSQPYKFASLPTVGDMKVVEQKGATHFELGLATAEGSFANVSCVGMVFDDRDFLAFREQSRQEMQAQAANHEPPTLTLAAWQKTTMVEGHPVLIGEPHTQQNQTVFPVLISSADGFYPEHPYHTGSGDHVNAGHLLDCALQACRYLLADTEDQLGTWVCTEGSARFKRFVELDIPFVLHLQAREHTGAAQRFKFQVEQAGVANTELMLQLERMP